jgi:ABC-type amino acid transport substrate-binding protein
VALVLCALVPAAAGVAGGCMGASPGSWAAVKRAGKLVVGTSPDYPPYEYTDAAGKLAGFDIELIHKIGEKLGIAVEIQTMGFDLLLLTLEQGKVDAVIACLSPNPQRREKADFTIPYYEGRQAVLAHRDSVVTVARPEDMRGRLLGVVTGTVEEDWVNQNLTKTAKPDDKKVIRYARLDQAAADLAAKRLELVFADLPSARSLEAKMPLKVVLACKVAGDSPCIAVRKGSKELTGRLDKTITELARTGFVDELADKYLSGQ